MKLQKDIIQQDALEKVNRVNEIRRSGKGGLKLTDNSTSKKCEVKGRVCELRLGQRGGSTYGKSGKGM